MTKYYIVTQADTDANGDFEYPVGIFADDDGNTQLCINAEEARQLIAEELAEMCETNVPFSLNDGEAVEFDLKSKIIEYVLQNMKPEEIDKNLPGSYIVTGSSRQEGGDGNA